jgi:hypothetical protein
MRPKEVRPNAGVGALLVALYPTIRWDAVTFHEGLPAVVRRFTNVAITLPAPLGTRGLQIYFAEGKWDPCSARGLGLIVHECFHVLQFQERMGGVGLGPLRGFTFQYLFRAIFEGGGKENLYEIPAYAHEKAFIAACRSLPRPLCSKGEIDLAMQVELLRRHPTLVRSTSREA